jgi:hypothetical protein
MNAWRGTARRVLEWRTSKRLSLLIYSAPQTGKSSQGKRPDALDAVIPAQLIS